jgi:hypothetical protein
MAMDREKSESNSGSYLDCADEILGIAADRSKAQVGAISRNPCLRSELPPEWPWVDLHRALILATQI